MQCNPPFYGTCLTPLFPPSHTGGAERLVVDAALALQQRGHSVRIYTSHHDPAHCFAETRDGTIDVRVHGDWLPRHVFGRMFALCAYVRMMYLAVALLLAEGRAADVVFCDQIAACIPILRLGRAKVRRLAECVHVQSPAVRG
eukprot:Opistho-1_new@47161